MLVSRSVALGHNRDGYGGYWPDQSGRDKDPVGSGQAKEGQVGWQGGIRMCLCDLKRNRVRRVQ